LTIRLADSLPREVLLKALDGIPERQQAERRAAVEELLDHCQGRCILRQPAVAALVEQSLLHFDGERYRTLAWCIMPNHVHWLIETVPEHALDRIMQSVKGFTGKAANQLLGQHGEFWEREYCDRAIRDAEHLRNTVEYIHNNPVKARLVTHPEQWRWSSAWGDRLGYLPL
jgi:putative DNA methylase